MGSLDCGPRVAGGGWEPLGHIQVCPCIGKGRPAPSQTGGINGWVALLGDPVGPVQTALNSLVRSDAKRASWEPASAKANVPRGSGKVGTRSQASSPPSRSSGAH